MFMSLVLGSLELDTALQEWPHQCWTEGKDDAYLMVAVVPMQYRKLLAAFAARAPYWLMFIFLPSKEISGPFLKNSFLSSCPSALSCALLFLLLHLQEPLFLPFIFLTQSKLDEVCLSYVLLWIFEQYLYFFWVILPYFSFSYDSFICLNFVSRFFSSTQASCCLFSSPEFSHSRSRIE